MNVTCDLPVKISACRSCKETRLDPLFSLGEQYVSDFVAKDQVYKGIKCHIDLVMCSSCRLVQQLWTAPQQFMYTRHYWYKSGTTDTMRAALAEVAETAGALVDLFPTDVVLDIGSNDGTLLRAYGDRAFTVGVEPAKNLAEEGAIGVKLLINEFWSYETYERAWRELRSNIRFFRDPGIPKAKIITALGMFYDLEDPNQFIADVAKVLHPEGIFIAQLMCSYNMLQMCDLGNLCHEHLEFYSLGALTTLLERHGLAIAGLEINKVNGQSYRLYITHANRLPPLGLSRRVDLYKTLYRQRKIEDAFLLDTPAPWYDFLKIISDVRERCLDYVYRLVANGRSVWGYGASTKGNVILQYFGIDHLLIKGIADRSPGKQGRYTIGTGIPIFSEQQGRDNANYFLVLPYAFLPEFIERERTWREAGGKFIVPLPEFKVV